MGHSCSHCDLQGRQAKLLADADSDFPNRNVQGKMGAADVPKGG